MKENFRDRYGSCVFEFDQTSVAYERLRAGDLHGRAIVTPNG